MVLWTFLFHTRRWCCLAFAGDASLSELHIIEAMVDCQAVFVFAFAICVAFVFVFVSVFVFMFVLVFAFVHICVCIWWCCNATLGALQVVAANHRASHPVSVAEVDC